MSAMGRRKTRKSREKQSVLRAFHSQRSVQGDGGARATFSSGHPFGSPGGSSAEAMSVPCPDFACTTLPAWLDTMTSPSSNSTPYFSSDPPPQFGAADTDIGDGCRNGDLVVFHLLDATGGKAERALGRLQRRLADAAIRIVDITIDHAARMLPKGD